MISNEENRLILAMASQDWVRPKPIKTKRLALELYYKNPKQLKLF